VNPLPGDNAHRTAGSAVPGRRYLAAASLTAARLAAVARIVAPPADARLTGGFAPARSASRSAMSSAALGRPSLADAARIASSAAASPLSMPTLATSCRLTGA